MKEVRGNIFDLAFEEDAPPTILLVTTNGVWDGHGDAVMGAGFAKAVREYFPDCPNTLGIFLRMHYNRLKDKPRADIEEPWNLPYKIGAKDAVHLFSFPTKPTKVTVTPKSVLPKYYSQRQHAMRIEGWKAYSQLPLIERSAKYIAGLLEGNQAVIQRVLSTRPGTLNGGLSWESQVKPLLAQYFVDDRFIIVERP